MSSKTKKAIRSTTLLAALAAVLIVTGMSFWNTEEADALPAGEVETYYFPSSMPASEWSLANYVGWKYIGCDGERILEGQVFTGNRFSIGGNCATGPRSLNCSINGNAVNCSVAEHFVDIVCGPNCSNCTC